MQSKNDNLIFISAATQDVKGLESLCVKVINSVLGLHRVDYLQLLKRMVKSASLWFLYAWSVTHSTTKLAKYIQYPKNVKQGICQQIGGFSVRHAFLV